MGSNLNFNPARNSPSTSMEHNTLQLGSLRFSPNAVVLTDGHQHTVVLVLGYLRHT